MKLEILKFLKLDVTEGSGGDTADGPSARSPGSEAEQARTW